MDELSSGATLGQYELLVRLGRGGMASVWVARPNKGQAESLLAVKAMLPELAQSSEFRAMFLEEGQIVRSIAHPNVVRVHEVGEHGGVLYMAMDWIEGDSLRAVIREARRRRPIPPEMAVKIIADAAAGLHAAHELEGWDGELRELVHCDVSPHNILVGLDGRAKIVDFGVANARLHSDVGGEGRVKGKFAYMSPEQARGQKLDRRSDVFSLGIVLYELTTGERLFRGENDAHTLALVTSGKVPDPRQVLDDYPAPLAAITLKALERDPARRFQTAAALQEALERYLVEERILVSHASVAKLVGRILGPRVEALRQSLREALAARDGTVREELIPASALRASSSDASASRGRPSFHSAGTPRPQTYETPIPERTNFAPLLAAIGGIAAAAASIFWMMHRPVVTATATASVAVDAPNAPVRRTTSGAEPAAEPGVDLTSLPLAASASASASAPPVVSPSRAGSRPGRGASALQAEPATKPAEPLTPEKVVLEPEPANVVLEEQAGPSAAPRAPATAPAAAAGPASAFNRGAALAQLGAAGGRATSCKRSGGPSGSGRATVTFAPDGSVARVTLGAPFNGTAAGACVVSSFSSMRVPAFTGSAVSLPGSFRVPD
jgi:serine/threonine protein kinase